MVQGSLSSVSGVVKMIILGFIVLFSSLLFTGLGALLSNSIFGVSVLNLATGLDFSGSNLNALKFMQIMQTTGIFIVPSFAAAFLYSDKPLRFLGFEPVKKGIYLKVFVLVLISLPAINLLASINELLPMSQWMVDMELAAERITKAFLVTDSAAAFMVNIVMIAILPAIGEELLFRGIIQKQLIRLTNSQWWGIVLAAAFFSAIHLQFKGFIPRFALGVMLGYLFAVTGSIWVAIAAHFFNNAIATVGYLFMGLGKMDKSVENIGGIQQEWLIGIICMGVAVALMVAIKNEYGLEKSEEFGDGAGY